MSLSLSADILPDEVREMLSFRWASSCNGERLTFFDELLEDATVSSEDYKREMVKRSLI